MYLKFFALIFLPFLPLLVEINGVAIFENSISSQPALFRRSPLELRIKSEGVGSGDGLGTSSTNFEMTDDPNDNSMNRLNVESNASGYGNGSNGGGYSSTSLNYSNNQDDGQNKMSLNTQAVGSGNGDFENSDGSGGVGISSTSLDLTTDDNGQDNRVRIQSEGVGVGSGNKGTGTSQTSLNFTSQPDSDNSDESSNDINLQSNAFGVGSGPSGVGGGTTSLHTKNNETGETLDVQSTGIGAGENGGIGASSLSLNSNGPSNTQVDSKAVGVGKGDDAVGITNTTLQTTDDDSTLETESTGVGIGDDNGTGLATSSLQAKEDNGRKTVDVNSTAVGTGDTEGVGLTNTTLEQKDSNGKTTKVDTTSVGQGNGDDSLGASQTSLHLDEDRENVNQQLDDTSLTEEENVNALNESGGMGLSTNGLYIEDDEEGDINIDTTALGSGNGTGASGIGLQMEDASSKGLKVQTTSEGIGDSSKGVGGSSTIVLVDDEANERSVDARSIGIGFNNDEGSGGYTADSLKYHDTDREHEEVVDTSSGAVSKTVTDETSKVDIQNASTDYHMISNDGTTTRSTQSSSTKTSKMSRVEKQSFYTTQGSIIQGQEDEIQNGDNVVFIPQVVDEDDVSLVDQDQEHVLVNQGSEQTTTLEENQLIFNEENAVEVISQDHNYVVSDEETLHTTNEDQRTFISNQESTRQIINKDYDYTASNYEIQSDQQSTRNVLNQDYDYSATNYEIQSNQQSTRDVVNENYEYSTTNYGIQQTESVDQDIFISDKQSSQQITNQEQAFILSNNQNSREVVNYNEENFVSSQQSSQQIMNQSSQQTVNVEQNTFMSNQQTEQDYVVSTQQKQNYNQTPSQQPSIGPRDIHPSTPANQPSSLLCPDNNRGPGVVCYYQVSSLFEYADGFILRPDAISTEYCDVLVVSYAVLDIDKLQIGAYSPDEECIFGELVKLKNRDLKVILQLQYVAFYEEYAKLLECDDNVNQFISAVVNSLRQWDFDGIELPLMIPQPNTNIHATAPIIKQNYPSLVQNLKSQLEQENLLLSICLPNDPDLIDSVYDIPELVEYVDWFSVNTIDYNGPDQGVLQYASPLTPQTLDDSFCIDYTVNSLIDQRGVPTDKVVINVPLYGSTFMLDNYKEKTYGAKVIGRGPPGPSSNTDGFLTISELCSLHQSNWLNTPAIVTDYDDVPTLVLKVTYARTKCLGGVAIHAITMDDPSGHLCESGSMPFTRAISLAYNPLRNAVSDEEDNDLLLVNYIDKSTTNKYEL